MWLLFTWVLANQAGVPISVVPSLIGAGVLAGAGHMSLVTIVVVTVTASVAADITWYSIGRWWGARAGALLEKFSRAATHVEVAKRRFVAHQLGFLFASRFLPELNPLAAGLAGAARIRPARYIVIVTVSALVWAATWTGAGYALGNVATGLSTPFGIVTGISVLAAAIAAIVVVLKHRRAARASVSTWP